MNRFYCLLLFFWATINPALAQEAYQAHTHVQLISEQDTVAAGSTFSVGLKLTPDEGWHLYWQNPGDSGYAPKVTWQVPSGTVTPGPVQWPIPERIDLGPLTSFGYGHGVLLIANTGLDKNFPASNNVSLHAHVDWLTCREMCVPGQADVELSLPVVADISGVSFNSNKEYFDQTRQDSPQMVASINSHLFFDGDQWHLDIQTPVKKQGNIIFYPYRDDVIEHPAAQLTRITPTGYEVTITKSHLYQSQQMSLTFLDGIAVNPSGWDEEGKIKAVFIHAPIEKKPAVTSPAVDILPAAHLSFWIACVFALIGGLVLNLMPCVLPVLSIKVLHLVERHPDRAIALRHSLIYAMGILVSVWSLAFLLFILKSAGQFAGWGFQFQSPVFVIIVALILLILALNLFGVFEFSTPSVGGLPPRQAGYQASFISGVVTTIVASPCTAPFMGTALTVAISQPGIVGFGIFTSLGLGLALPFVLLSAFPFLLSFVPKPGPWMVHLKRVLGLILIACVIWLGWVFGLQTGLGDLSKIYKPSNGIHWQSYSATGVSQARQAGHGVFIDFTAAWCINCQVNDRLVLQNSAVVNAFKEDGIIAFKGDWTKNDPAITQALASFGRDSIPVYIYYPPGANTPIILPQLITPKMILGVIARSAATKQSF